VTIRKFSSELNSSKSKKASEELLVLCEEIYKVYIQSQDFTSQDLDNENIGDRFKDWFERQKEDLHVKESCSIPEDFPPHLWNWEFEDEFQRYLPTYIDILHEVDAMDYCPEYDYSCRSTLIEKHSPKFRLKHDISSHLDCHVQMIDKMMQRKLVEEYPKRRSHQMEKWLCKLITTKPYLKNSYDRNIAVSLLMEDLTVDAKLSHLDVRDVVDMFYNVILLCLEPQFHPLIREGHKDFLMKIAHQFIFAEGTNCYEPLEPEPEDFLGYLQPHASSYIYRMKIESKYSKARKQVCLHQEFDKYLAEGKLDEYMYMFDSSQDKFVQEFSDKYLPSYYGKLDSKLIRLSLQERAQIVDMQRQIDTYSENLRNILANKQKDSLEKLMNKLEEEGFFDVDNDSTDWGKTCFVSLIDEFKMLVFEGHCYPQCFAVQGIMEYWRISKGGDIAAQVDLEKAIEAACSRWKKNIAELWTDTRYYEESYYDFIRNPSKKIFLRKDKPQNQDKPATMVE